MNRREFLNVLAAASAAGFPLASREVLAQPGTGDAAYDVPRFGNVSLLHFTDCHAQLLPSFFREPSVNLGLGAARGKPPHLVGEALLKHFGIPAGTRDAHAFTYLDSARLIILKTRVVEGVAPGSPAAPGTIVGDSRDAIHVAAGPGTCLAIEQLQPEGRKPMTAREFLSGRALPSGSRLSRP